MIRTRPLVWFVLRFLVLFLVLVLPWTHVISHGYAAFFRAIGNALFTNIHDDSVIAFERMDGDPERDTRVSFKHKPTGYVLPVGVNSRNKGFIATAFVAALVLATPFRWRRRLITLAVCLVVMTGFVALRQYIFIAGVIYTDLDDWQKKTLAFLNWICVESFAGEFVIPLGIWGMISFRRKDFEEWLNFRRAD